jgi:DNA-binding beta-propeller fold protein YncE
MKTLRILLMATGLIYGASDLALAKTVNVTVQDVPGYWFDTGKDIAGTRSLVIIAPGDTVRFNQKVESRHTVTSLIWPKDAGLTEKIDQDVANTDDHQVTLTTPGLYVYVCKLHPYMLGAVIVDDKATEGLDIGKELQLVVGTLPDGLLTFDSASDLALRLLRAFFIVTNPSNWKDYTKANLPSPGNIYQPTYPEVPIRVYSGNTPIVAPLGAAVRAQGYDGGTIPVQVKPSINGVGEVWVDTQYELSAGKKANFPGTATVADATTWEVTKKIALPKQKMNNGHNLWPSHDQKQMYQTEWHGKSLYVLNREDGKLLQELEIGHDPAHVMTRVDTQQVHVGLNGEDGVVELNRDPVTGLLTKHRVISMQLDPNNPGKATQPHAHWMGHDGLTMATPNANSNDSSLFDFSLNEVVSKLPTGALSIAVGMMPDSSKYYVSNYLGHSLSVINMNTLTSGPNTSLLLGYDPISGSTSQAGFVCTATLLGGSPCLIGGLPVQTPVSPDGKFAIQGNTLGGTITIVDTTSNQVVKILPCDPGCHGVQFGAKAGGGYYAYVTSKFANRLIVLDYDPGNIGTVDNVKNNARIAGWVILAKNDAPADDKITGNYGMGGQGVMPIPNVYNGWVQKLPNSFCPLLTTEQKNPLGNLPPENCN